MVRAEIDIYLDTDRLELMTTKIILIKPQVMFKCTNNIETNLIWIAIFYGQKNYCWKENQEEELNYDTETPINQGKSLRGNLDTTQKSVKE